MTLIMGQSVSYVTVRDSRVCCLKLYAMEILLCLSIWPPDNKTQITNVNYGTYSKHIEYDYSYNDEYVDTIECNM